MDGQGRPVHQAPRCYKGMARHKQGCSPLGRQGQATSHHPHPTFSPTHLSVGFAAWVDSPVVWALPASATESGFLLGAESAPLFSALTTEPVRCVLGETQHCYVTCAADPLLEYLHFLLFQLLLGPQAQARTARPLLHFPTQIPQHWTTGSVTRVGTPDSILPLFPDSQGCPLVAREDPPPPQLFLLFEKHTPRSRRC